MATVKIKEKKAFIDLIGKASAAASTKNDSIRSGIMVHAKENQIVIRSMNDIISVQLNAKDNTETSEETSFVVPAKLFFDMMKKLPEGDVELIVADNGLLIKVGKSKYGISTFSVDEFPLPVAYEEGIIFQVDALTLAASSSMMLHACAEHESRPILTGVNIVSNGKYLTLIATDSHRLMASAVPVLKETEEFKNVIVPQSSIKELITLLSDEKEVEFSVSENQLSLRTEGVQFTTRLLQGSYPDITKLIPKEFESEVVLYREEMLKALDRTKTALGKSGKVSHFHIKDGTLPTLNIECKTEITNVFEELFIEEAGGELSVKLDVFYLIDCLKSMNSKKVRFQLAGTTKPMLVRPEIEGATQFGLILPVR